MKETLYYPESVRIVFFILINTETHNFCCENSFIVTLLFIYCKAKTHSTIHEEEQRCRIM